MKRVAIAHVTLEFYSRKQSDTFFMAHRVFVTVLWLTDITENRLRMLVLFNHLRRNCIGQHFAMHEQKIVLARILRRWVNTLWLSVMLLYSQQFYLSIKCVLISG